MKEERKILKQIFIMCGVVTIFGILSLGIMLKTYNDNLKLKKTIETKNEEIYNLENDIERYKMISNEFEELFLNCVNTDNSN